MRGNLPLTPQLLPEATALPGAFPRPVLWEDKFPRGPGAGYAEGGEAADLPAALKPKPAGTGECSASSSRMTTSDTLIGQALAGAGPGGLRRGWESSREAGRPEAGSAATTSAPLPPTRRSSSSHNPPSHNNLHFRLPAAVADPQGYACADRRAPRLAGVAAA